MKTLILSITIFCSPIIFASTFHTLVIGQAVQIDYGGTGFEAMEAAEQDAKETCEQVYSGRRGQLGEQVTPWLSDPMATGLSRNIVAAVFRCY